MLKSKAKRKKEQEERLKEMFRIKIISEYTTLCKILESDGSCREKVRDYVLHELEHGSLELEKSFEGFTELQIGVDGLKNYKFSVLYQIITAGVRKEEFHIQNPLAAAKMISSMMAGWDLVKQSIDFSCYPKEDESMTAGNKTLADSVFALLEMETVDSAEPHRLAHEPALLEMSAISAALSTAAQERRVLHAPKPKALKA